MINPRSGILRRSPRLRVQIDGCLSGRSLRRVRILDLSMTGCLIQCDTDLDFGAILDLELQISPNPLMAKVRVADSCLDGVAGEQGTRRFLVGLEFIALSVLEETRLRRFLDDERGARGVRTRPLTEVAPRELRALLEEESIHWAQQFLWDYSRRLFGGLQRPRAQRPAGSCSRSGPRARLRYYMLDGGRAIVGSVFAAAATSRARGSRRSFSTPCSPRPKASREQPRRVPDAVLHGRGRGRAGSSRPASPGRTPLSGAAVDEPARGTVPRFTLRALRREDFARLARSSTAATRAAWTPR